MEISDLQDPNKIINLNSPNHAVRVTLIQFYRWIYIDKFSDREISNLLGVTSKTVKNYRRKHQLTTNFQIGTMDLPLSQVIYYLSLDYNCKQIADELNTTKTAVYSFITRHGLTPNFHKWPIDRQKMIDLVLNQFTNDQIAEKFSVSDEEVSELQVKYGIDPFEGEKSFNRDMGPRVDIEYENQYDIAELAHIYFGKEFREHPKIGFMINNKPINAIDLSKLIKRIYGLERTNRI